MLGDFREWSGFLELPGPPSEAEGTAVLSRSLAQRTQAYQESGGKLPDEVSLETFCHF